MLRSSRSRTAPSLPAGLLTDVPRLLIRATRGVMNAWPVHGCGSTTSIPNTGSVETSEVVGWPQLFALALAWLLWCTRRLYTSRQLPCTFFPAQASFFLSFWQGPVSSCFSALSLLETVLFHLPMASCFCLVVPSAGVYFLRSFLRVSAFLLGPPSASLKAHTYVGVVSLKFGEVLDYDVK